MSDLHRRRTPSDLLDLLTRAPLHIAWVISADLCAILDKRVYLGHAISIIIPAADSLSYLIW